MYKIILRYLVDIKSILQRLEKGLNTEALLLELEAKQARLEELENDKSLLDIDYDQLRKENAQLKADIQSLSQTVFTAHESLAKLLQYQVALNEAVGIAYADATIPDFVISEQVLKIHCGSEFKQN